MTRSIFDPAGGETERSGSRNLGPDAGNLSHMPPDVIDGNADDEAEDEAQVRPAEVEQQRPCNLDKSHPGS